MTRPLLRALLWLTLSIVSAPATADAKGARFDPCGASVAAVDTAIRQALTSDDALRVFVNARPAGGYRTCQVQALLPLFHFADEMLAALGATVPLVDPDHGALLLRLFPLVEDQERARAILAR